MSNNRGFNVETVIRSNTIRVLSKLFGMKAFAESEDEEDTTSTAPIFDYEKMIAQARKEEKDKLYPRMKKLEDTNKLLTKSNNDNLLEVARLKEELETFKAGQQNIEDSQVVKDLRKKLGELEVENETLQKSKPDEEAIKAQIKAEYEVKLHLTTQLNENKDNILPVFAKSVTGKTKEEVDASIQNAINETIETKKTLGILDEDGNPIDTNKKNKGNKPPIANPSGAKDKDFDLETVKNLDVRSKEYAEYRKSQGLR
jgi:hypothetical protein